MKRNWKIIDVEKELKIAKAKEKASAIMQAEEAKNYHLGMFSEGTRTTIKYIFLCICALMFGVFLSVITYFSLNEIAMNNIKEAKNYMLGLLPYMAGFFSILLIIWHGKIGFCLKSFNIGFLFTNIWYLFKGVELFLSKDERIIAFTKAMSLTKNNTELYSFMIIFIVAYFILLFANVALAIRQVINDN